MSDPVLRRTIRRCVAVLLVPLSLIPMMVVAWLEEQGLSLSAAVLQTGDDVAMVVFLGAICYLVGSLGMQVTGAASASGEAAAENEAT